MHERDPANADFGPAVEVVRADLQHPDTLDAAFAGVQKAFVLVNGPDIAALEGNAFDAARRAGVEHIVKMSALESFQEHMAGTVTARAHQDSESRLRQTGVTWTMLRPAFFASNFHTYFLRKSPVGAAMFLRCGDGKEATIDPRDIAAAAVSVLTSNGHEGKVYELTGPELIGFAEVAELMSRVTGVSIEYVDVTENDAYARLLADGFLSAFADYVVRHHFAAVKSGKMRLASGIPDLLGRPRDDVRRVARAEQRNAQQLPPRLCTRGS
jgi:uncharacterized protein YbjT (DUF2867 family)